jgi:phage major head subunit gpT-like protein
MVLPPKNKTGVGKNQTSYMVFSIDQNGIDEENRTVDLSITSEILIKRWWGNIVLGHNPGECRLDRVKTVGSFLFAHGRDPQYGVMPLGSIVDVYLDQSARKYRAKLKFDTDEKSELVWQKVQSGSLKGISIGANFFKWLEVEAGQTERGFSGPVSIALDWEIIEISLEPTPAIPNVGVGLSLDETNDLTDNGHSDIENEEENDMKFKVIRDGKEVEVLESELTSEERVQLGINTHPVVPAPPTAAPTLQEQLAAERSRWLQIENLCNQFSIETEQKEKFIKDGITVDEVNRFVLDKLSRERTGVVTVQRDETEKFKMAAADGFAMRAGVAIEKPSPGALDFRGFSMVRLAEECVRRSGQRFNYADPMESIRLAIAGTSDYPYILANVANKTMMQSYSEVPTTWQIWARVVPATDFKTMYRNQLSEAPDLEKVYESGEYKHATFTDTRESYAIATYGKKFSISRQAIINDDMGALTRIPALMGAAAARLVNQTVYGIVTANGAMADGTALFHADHSNLAGTGAALSVTSLGAARAAMRKQKGIGAKATLNITPRYLLIPAALETIAEQLIGSIVDPTKNNSTINPFANKLQIVTDAILDANSITAWYLIAQYNQVDTIEVAFLSGNQTPMLERQLGWDVDGMEFKIRHDVGAKAIDHRGMYKNAGA